MNCLPFGVRTMCWGVMSRPKLPNAASWRPADLNVSSLANSPNKYEHNRQPKNKCILRKQIQLEQEIYFYLREFVRDETQVCFVQPKRFSIYVAPVCHAVAIRAKRNEVLVSVFLALRPRHDVMNVNLYVAAGRNRAPMTGFNKHPAT